MTITKHELLNSTIAAVLEKYPFADSFFSNHDLDITNHRDLTLAALLNSLDADDLEEKAFDGDSMVEQLATYIRQMIEFLGENNREITSVTILPGTDKSGEPESFDKLVIRPGDIICIVGPTGSGKSRLLADIEWVAQNDTPTSRTILIDDAPPDPKWRFSSSDKLVAQLSQNMNFVMDLTVREFLQLHAESRMVEEQDRVIAKIITEANALAGEKFDPDTPVTSLSGGQSRALMIADTAVLSKSPIVLIDEIENAGINRKQALNLLLSEDKIVFMATHDPMLALMGHRRIVIRNGGVHRIIETTDEERRILGELEQLNAKMLTFRTKLRQGERLTLHTEHS